MQKRVVKQVAIAPFNWNRVEQWLKSLEQVPQWHNFEDALFAHQFAVEHDVEFAQEQRFFD